MSKPWKLQGTGTALVTPFRADGGVDEPALARLVDYQIEGGVDILLPCGTTGEAATLNESEWERVIAFVVERAAGRVPVFAGAGSNDTAHAVALARRAAALGADGVLSVGPYYNKPEQAGFYAHFKAVAEAAAVPVILYNIPGRTGSNMTAETTLRLAEVPGIAGVKEASGNPDQISEIIRRRPEGFRVLAGDDALTLPLIALGADGAVSVISNQAPALFGEMVHAALDGDFAHARGLHYRLLPLMRANFLESNPAPAKALLAMMGLMEDHCRLPLVPSSPATRERVAAAGRAIGLLDGASQKKQA